MIRPDVRPRWDAFQSGLQRCGFSVAVKLLPTVTDRDVLVLWNRHRHSNEARRFEMAGGKIIIAENGWIGRAPDGNKMIALCRDHHNGLGRWSEGPEDRWAALGIELQPWRERGGHILVLAQRGIGERGVAQPHGWAEAAAAQLRQLTSRQVIVRKHPGIHEPPPEPDWRGCWAAVTWASGAAIKAIVAGVPVLYGLAGWIGAAAARFGLNDIENPYIGDRLPMLRRLAHAQWSRDEIATGEPFARLLAL